MDSLSLKILHRRIPCVFGGWINICIIEATFTGGMLESLQVEVLYILCKCREVYSPRAAAKEWHFFPPSLGFGLLTACPDLGRTLLCANMQKSRNVVITGFFSTGTNFPESMKCPKQNYLCSYKLDNKNKRLCFYCKPKIQSIVICLDNSIAEMFQTLFATSDRGRVWWKWCEWNRYSVDIGNIDCWLEFMDFHWIVA